MFALGVSRSLAGFARRVVGFPIRADPDGRAFGRASSYTLLRHGEDYEMFVSFTPLAAVGIGLCHGAGVVWNSPQRVCGYARDGPRDHAGSGGASADTDSRSNRV